MISEIQIEPIKYKVDNQHVNILLNKLVDGEATYRLNALALKRLLYLIYDISRAEEMAKTMLTGCYDTETEMVAKRLIRRKDINIEEATSIVRDCKYVPICKDDEEANKYMDSQMRKFTWGWLRPKG